MIPRRDSGTKDVLVRSLDKWHRVQSPIVGADGVEQLAFRSLLMTLEALILRVSQRQNLL